MPLRQPALDNATLHGHCSTKQFHCLKKHLLSENLYLAQITWILLQLLTTSAWPISVLDGMQMRNHFYLNPEISENKNWDLNIRTISLPPLTSVIFIY